jgi:hypothetical protein
MAESQDIFVYDPNVLNALDKSLSPSRLAPYLVAAKGNRQLALKHYLWNARLAKAFLFPLQVVEVTTRNAVHRALASEYGGEDWIIRMPFALTQGSSNSRQRAIDRLDLPAGSNPLPDKLVAALTFDFWSNLFRRDYDAVWSRPGLLAAVFPHLPAGEGRHEVQSRVREINWLRNRIAHHEPIHQNVNHKEHHDLIIEMIGLSCRSTQDWAKRHSTVMAVVRSPPTAVSTLPGLPLRSANLRAPILLTRDATLTDAIGRVLASRPPLALVPNAASSPSYAAVSAERLLAFVRTRSVDLDNMIDLGAYTIGDVLDSTPDILLRQIDSQATTGDATAAFFPPNTSPANRPQVLVVVDAANPAKPIGVMERPEIRY